MQNLLAKLGLLYLHNIFPHICVRCSHIFVCTVPFSFYDTLIPSIHIAAASTVGMLEMGSEKGVFTLTRKLCLGENVRPMNCGITLNFPGMFYIFFSTLCFGERGIIILIITTPTTAVSLTSKSIESWGEGVGRRWTGGGHGDLLHLCDHVGDEDNDDVDDHDDIVDDDDQHYNNNEVCDEIDYLDS